MVPCALSPQMREHCTDSKAASHIPTMIGKLRMLWTSQWEEGRKEGNEQSGGDSLGNASFKEAYPCPLWPISIVEGKQVFFFFTDTQGISQTQAFKTDFQNRPWCQRIDLAGIINHLRKQNLNLRDKADDKKGILYGKLLDMGVKQSYHLWQENKSCHQEQFAGKGKLRRIEQGSQKCRRVSQVGRKSHDLDQTPNPERGTHQVPWRQQWWPGSKPNDEQAYREQ